VDPGHLRSRRRRRSWRIIPSRWVAALAGAGEVLVSGTVKDLVAGSGLRFVDRGSQTLKGIPGEWRIYAVDR
jgi:class 3 adenylate cyclase